MDQVQCRMDGWMGHFSIACNLVMNKHFNNYYVLLMLIGDVCKDAPLMMPFLLITISIRFIAFLSPLFGLCGNE